jgi:hypothetical protein
VVVLFAVPAGRRRRVALGVADALDEGGGPVSAEARSNICGRA